MPDGDAVEIDTARLRDVILNLDKLLGAANDLAGKLDATTIPPEAFGKIGFPVHAATQRLQTQAGQAVTAVAGAWQALTKLASDFALFSDKHEQLREQQLREIQRRGRAQR